VALLAGLELVGTSNSEAENYLYPTGKPIKKIGQRARFSPRFKFTSFSSKSPIAPSGNRAIEYPVHRAPHFSMPTYRDWFG
jgi:hypothetical protein